MRRHRLLLALPIMLLAGLPIEATTYTVKPSGGSFTTISACAGTAVAGDTCDVFTGSYAGWTQNANGTSGNPITFQQHAGETATITSTVTISSRSYIVLSHLNFTAVVNGNGTTAHNVIDHCVFTGHTKVFNIPDGLGTNGSDNVFSNNTVNVNSTASNQPSLYIFGDRNRIENNEIYNAGGDCMNLGGANVVVRGNYCHDLDGGTSGEHIDFIQIVGGGNPTLSFSLVENNVEKTCTNDGSNCHFIIVRTSGVGTADTIIVRYNYWYNLDSAGSVDFGGVGDNVPNSHFYNNTVSPATLYNGSGACASWQNANGGYARNNICYNTNANGTAPFLWSSSTGGSNGNLAFTTGYSGAWNSPYSAEATYAALHNQNPLFATFPADGTLQVSSPAIGAGVALTAVSSGDSGSGTTLIVNDAAFFQPGWAGASADWLRIGPSTTVQISSINYATNTITLANAISRSPGTPVYLYKDSNGKVVLFGNNPDVGAYPYASGGLTAPGSLTAIVH